MIKSIILLLIVSLSLVVAGPVFAQAEVETDRALLDEIWDSNPLLRQYLGTPDNPDLVVYRIEPVQVRYMKEWALEYVDISITNDH